MLDVMHVHLTIDIPEAVAEQPHAELAGRARTLLIVDEVRCGRMTRSRAARTLGMALDGFLPLAAQHGVDSIDQSVEELRLELDDISRCGF